MAKKKVCYCKENMCHSNTSSKGLFKKLIFHLRPHRLNNVNQCANSYLVIVLAKLHLVLLKSGVLYVTFKFIHLHSSYAVYNFMHFLGIEPWPWQCDLQWHTICNKHIQLIYSLQISQFTSPALHFHLKKDHILEVKWSVNNQCMLTLND